MSDIREGDHVRCVMPLHERASHVTRWYAEGQVVQSNARKQRALVRWDADKMTDFVDWHRLTVLTRSRCRGCDRDPAVRNANGQHTHDIPGCRL